MEQVFSVYKIESNQIIEKNQVVFHGRALKLLKQGQTIYLTNNHGALGKIIGIVSYGHTLEEIEPVMGCTLMVKFEENMPISENIEWLYG